MRRLQTTLVLAVACTLPRAALATSYVVNTIEVMGVAETNLGDAIASQICQDLSASLKDARVLCPADIKAMLQARADALSLGVDSAIESTGDLVDAKRGISGSLASIERRAVLQLSLLDLAHGKVLARSSVTVPAGDLRGILKGASRALVELFESLER